MNKDEPKGLSTSYKNNNAIASKNHNLTLDEALLVLDNIEGLVVVDEKGRIRYFAKDLLSYAQHFNSDTNSVVGEHILDVHPHSKILDPIESSLETRHSFYSTPFGTNIARLVPLYKDGKLKGAIDYDIFRDAADIDALFNAMAQVPSGGYFDIESKAKRILDSHKPRKFTKYHIGDIIGKSPSIVKLRQQISQVAPTETTVLLTGETGTGKELVAHSIHNLSERRDSKLIEVNCAGIPDTLIESELFGYAEGSFTGAQKKGKPGLFELASGGTLFLDEVNQLPYNLQPKLLRVLQEKEVSRIGSNETIPVDARIISATNQDLKTLVEEGVFREDLYFRLNVFNIDIAPLRERASDIPLLIKTLMTNINPRIKKNITNIDKEALNHLYNYSWPGNIRELRNLLERAMINCYTSTLSIKDFKDSFFDFSYISNDSPLISSEGSLSKKVASYEKHIIETTLNETNWNISKAAKQLEISRPTLYYKIDLYNIVQIK